MFVEGGGSKKRFLQKGEILFREGDPGDAAYIVNSGEVAICKLIEGEEVELGTLRAGELFGEMAIVDGTKRMAYAVAKEESVVIQVPATAVENKLAKADPFLRALMKIFVNNLRTVHQSYMRRARSVSDYLNALHYHTQGFRLYMTRGVEGEQSTAGLEKLDRIEELLDELRELFKDHPDRRESVLQDVDLGRDVEKD